MSTIQVMQPFAVVRVAIIVAGLLHVSVAPAFESTGITNPPRDSGRRRTPVTSLAIAEIMYQPDDSGAEFVELINFGEERLLIGGFRFSDGVSFEFPAGLWVQPGDRVVVAGSQDDFSAAYPDVTAVGFYSGKLSNSGERLALSYPTGQVLLSLRYDDDAPWPTEADGLGHSMVISNVTGEPGDPLNWCASAAIGGSPGEAETQVCPTRFDLTDAVFDPDRVLRIEIELDPDDWEALRQQERNLFEIFVGDDCLAEPFGSPFTYFPGTVTIDGETVENVGVRKKGFLGSLSRTKPALKIKFNEYVTGQRFSGLRLMTLNNAIQDPSYLNQCLGYDLFRAAGVPAPRCNFSTVKVNGLDLGLYVHVESVKERFLARHFERNDGNLYEGTLSDFRPEFVNTFEQKTNEEDDARLDLDAVVDVMDVADDGLVAALEEVIDLDAYLTFWVMDVLLANWDGYAGNTNNFYIYNDPTSERFHFIPWGIDNLFSLGEDQDGGTRQPAVMATGVLPRRLYLNPSTRDLYVNRVVKLLNTVWDEAAIHDEIDRMSALISPFLIADELATFNQAVPLIRSFVDDRRASLFSDLFPEPPPWEEPLRDPVCFETLGEIWAGFDSTWGTFNVVDPFEAGTGSFELVLPDETIVPLFVGSSAGPSGSSQREAAILIMSVFPGDRFLAILIETDPDLMVSGTDPVFDFSTTLGLLVYFGPDTSHQAQIIGLLADGYLHFDEVSTIPGEAMRGTLHATVYDPAF